MYASRNRRFDTGMRLTMPLMVALVLAGCVDVRHREYAPVEFALDDRNVLRISTYPSWFARDTTEIPFLKTTSRTAGSVYFEVYVRDAKKKNGPNPNVQSIRIKSFSYQIADRAPVVLIENYDHYFWMQDNANYNKAETTPIPWVEGQRLKVAVSLVLNGTAHELKTEMLAVEHRSTRSLLVHELME